MSCTCLIASYSSAQNAPAGSWLRSVRDKVRNVHPGISGVTRLICFPYYIPPLRTCVPNLQNRISLEPFFLTLLILSVCEISQRTAKWHPCRHLCIQRTWKPATGCTTCVMCYITSCRLRYSPITSSHQ